MDQRYLLHDPREIRRVLQALIDNRSLISAYLAPGGTHCPTAILELDDGGLLIDGHQQEAFNQRIAAAHHLTCTSQLERVRVQFRLQRLVRVQAGGYTAFRAPLPESVLELQRRELYRITVPVNQPVPCTVPLPGPEGEAANAVDLRVLDISGGGLALLIPDDVAAAFRPPAEFADCLLHLPDTAPLQLRLAVCHLDAHAHRNGVALHAGCRFVGLPRMAESQIQHYIFRVERQRTARERRAV